MHQDERKSELNCFKYERSIHISGYMHNSWQTNCDAAWIYIGYFGAAFSSTMPSTGC